MRIEKQWLKSIWKAQAKKHQAKWSATLRKYQCMRCGNSSQGKRTRGRCEDPRWMRQSYEERERGEVRTWEGTVWYEEFDPNGAWTARDTPGTEAAER